MAACGMAADEGDWMNKLLDPEIDAHHRSLLCMVQPSPGQPRIEFTAQRTRTPMTLWTVDSQWLPRLSIDVLM
ncbi:hypothetical protein E2562_028172 [Oryza meyeriana var. granulata]|uniref:Uncharacterized protein n=1 Tax=Oryza meyeriana var. granulata TaxID=110450 RepID=A0A6G1CU55_9ORYZ|nr:hypothetical protein E2562_028172 [Oryza meyeriana var. granulata]